MNTFRCSGITSGGGDMYRSQLVDRAAQRAADNADDTSERVTLPDFGSLTRTARQAGTAGNTHGAAVEIAATKGVKFTAGAGFKSAVN
jgi:nucleoid DNA-binding protein